MDKENLIKRIAEKLAVDPDMLKRIGDLTLGTDECKIAEEQTPDTMYVLTGRVKVEAEDEEIKYHYHPVVKDCLLNPNASSNEMVASPDLIELQGVKDCYSIPTLGVEYVILAVTYEVYKKLQEQLDETIAGVIENMRHAAEAFMRNTDYTPKGMLDFEKIYQDVMYQLMKMSNTMIGSALSEKSKIIENISDVSYEGLNISQCSDEECECDHDCCNCSCEFCSEDDEDEDDEEDDDDSGGTTMFFWIS